MGKTRNPRLQIDGVRKDVSHRVWYENTGHWPVGEEVIHHRDSNPLNNKFENLQLMSNAEHTSLHQSGESNHFFGKTHNKESRDKISVALMGERNYRWQGDAASDHAKYGRVWRARRRAEQI